MGRGAWTWGADNIEAGGEGKLVNENKDHILNHFKSTGPNGANGTET